MSENKNQAQNTEKESKAALIIARIIQVFLITLVVAAFCGFMWLVNQGALGVILCIPIVIFLLKIK